jgi:hypothetical protein
LDELSVAFGTSKNMIYIATHNIAESLGPAKSSALALFHVFTGCDNVSFFTERGEKTAWKAQKAFELGDVHFYITLQFP